MLEGAAEVFESGRGRMDQEQIFQVRETSSGARGAHALRGLPTGGTQAMGKGRMSVNQRGRKAPQRLKPLRRNARRRTTRGRSTRRTPPKNNSSRCVTYHSLELLRFLEAETSWINPSAFFRKPAGTTAESHAPQRQFTRSPLQRNGNLVSKYHPPRKGPLTSKWWRPFGRSCSAYCSITGQTHGAAIGLE